VSNRRKRRKMIPVPVASMGDIAFLLIIFFMVCSRFAKDPGVSIDPPTTIDVNKLDDYPLVVLIDREAQIFFQGRPVDSAAQVEEEVRLLVEGKNEEKARTVLFRCDRSIDKRVFEPVIEAIAKGGGRIAAVGEQTTSP